MREAELRGLFRACKYSVIPNELGFCGPANSFKKLLPFIESPSKEKADEVKQALQQFHALFPYLELVAFSHNRNPFDESVIEAYWLGNSLLENVQRRGLQRTILSFQRFGLPAKIAEEKAASLPKGMLPHHSFHVLYVNFINPAVKPIVQNLSNCLVQWAAVKEVRGKKLRVKGIELFSESGQLKLREKLKSIENSFKIELQKGDFVSVHWNKAVEKISEEKAEQLRQFTLQNLGAVKGL